MLRLAASSLTGSNSLRTSIHKLCKKDTFPRHTLHSQLLQRFRHQPHHLMIKAKGLVLLIHPPLAHIVHQFHNLVTLLPSKAAMLNEPTLLLLQSQLQPPRQIQSMAPLFLRTTKLPTLSLLLMHPSQTSQHPLLMLAVPLLSVQKFHHVHAPPR